MAFNNEIEEVKAQIKVLEKKLSLLEEIENHKTPCEEAYKNAYGYYPKGRENGVWTIGDADSWTAFQDGYKSAQKDYKVGEYQETAQERGERLHKDVERVVKENLEWFEENPDQDPLDCLKPQTPEQVADGLKEAFREAIKQGVVSSVDKPKDDFIDKMVAELKGQSLTDLIYDWWGDVFTTHSDWSMETSIENLVDMIEEFLPKEHDTNSYKWNECIRMIKSKLR